QECWPISRSKWGLDCMGQRPRQQRPAVGWPDEQDGVGRNQAGGLASPERCQDQGTFCFVLASYELIKHPPDGFRCQLGRVHARETTVLLLLADERVAQFDALAADADRTRSLDQRSNVSVAFAAE